MSSEKIKLIVDSFLTIIIILSYFILFKYVREKGWKKQKAISFASGMTSTALISMDIIFRPEINMGWKTIIIVGTFIIGWFIGMLCWHALRYSDSDYHTECEQGEKEKSKSHKSKQEPKLIIILRNGIPLILAILAIIIGIYLKMV